MKELAINNCYMDSSLHKESRMMYGLYYPAINIQQVEAYSLSYGKLIGHYVSPTPQNVIAYITKGLCILSLIDVNPSSKTYQKIISFEWNEGDIVYIPPFVAYGWYCISNSISIVLTMDKRNDNIEGIHYRSSGWNHFTIFNPDISERDDNFPMLDEYIKRRGNGNKNK